MKYCSLDDAFQSVQGDPQAGCTDSDAARQARKEERRKARKSKMIPMGSYVDGSKDIDRQHLNPLPDVPAMNPASDSFDSYNKAKHNSHSNPSTNPYPPTTSQYDKDQLDDYSKAEYENHYMTIPVNGNSVTASKRFFGAHGPTDEPYADYTPDDTNHLLQPDFTKAFRSGGTSRAGTSSALPPPQMDMYWKPLTQSGTETSFLPNSTALSSFPSGMASTSASSASASASASFTREHLPPHHSLRSAYQKGEISMEDVMKKLDTLFTKLDDMNHSTPEQLTSEMLMFISSGIFVLFLMDLLVKRGGSMRF